MSKLEEIKAKMETEKQAKLQQLREVAAAENPEAAAALGDVAAIASTVSAPHPEAPKVTPEGALSVTAGAAKPMLDEDRIPQMRIFRSRVPGSSFVMREGYTIYFHDGWYETTDPSEISQLDGVANKVPTIYTEENEQAIVAAVIEARARGYTGSVADAMHQQLTAEQRIQALRLGSHSNVLPGQSNVLKLPTDVPVGVSQADANSREAALRAAIKSASAQSNSK